MLAFSAHGSWAHFAQRYPDATGGIAGFFAALAAALWAYDGWSDLNMVGEEVRDPERNIPLALIGGLLVIGALYMLVNAAVQYALPPLLVAQSSSPMSDAVRASFLGASAAAVVSAAMVISLTTSLNGVAMSGSRMAFALARDGNFFSDLANVHPRFRTPHVAITAQAILSVCFLLIEGISSQLFTLALFARMALVRGRKRLIVCVPRANARPGAPASRLGISAGTRPFYSSVGSPSLLHFHEQLTIFSPGKPRDPGRHPGLLRIRPFVVGFQHPAACEASGNSPFLPLQH